MRKKNNKSKKYNFISLCYFFSISISVIVIIYITYISFFIDEKHYQKLNEFEMQMKIVEKQSKALSNAAIGTRYDNLIKNKSGFWQDDNGYVFDIEFHSSGINVITPLGKLNEIEQKKLKKQFEKEAKNSSFHKKEVGIAIYDAGGVKEMLDSQVKIK